MKKKHLLQIIVVALIVVGAAYILSTTIKSVQADQSGLQDKIPGIQHESQLSLPEKVTKDDLAVQVLDYQWERNEARFDVKISLPDSRDWLIRKAYLEVEGKRFSLWGTDLVELVSPAVDGEQSVLRQEDGVVEELMLPDTGEAYRIDTLIFGDVPVDLYQKAFNLVIQEISTTPDETSYCNPGIQVAIREPMEAAFPGIEIECMSEPGFLGYQIAPTSKYSEDAEVQEYFSNTIDQVLNTILVGPWNFGFDA
jgi:hypothetical protein